MPAEKMFKVTYSKFVVEGDNYAGFSGYRDFTRVLLSEEAYKDWMAKPNNDIRITRIEVFTYEPAGQLDIKAEVADAKERLKQAEKANEIKRLEVEAAKVQSKLKALKNK